MARMGYKKYFANMEDNPHEALHRTHQVFTSTSEQNKRKVMNKATLSRFLA